ncbi:MAG: DUF3857 domain-containing protein [Tunicatimonas sp.]
MYATRYLYLLLFAGFLANPGVAQKKKDNHATWQELRQSYYPGDSTTPAAILRDEGQLWFEYRDDQGFVALLTRTVKIKIYSTEGLGWGNVAVGYYDGGYRQENVTDVWGTTFNEENGRIAESKLTSDAIFQDDFSEHGRVKKFALPNVRPGSVIVYSYTLRSPYLMTLRDWQFQYEIPVQHSELTARIPAFYQYSILRHGYAELSANEAEVLRGEKRLGRYTYNDAKYRWEAQAVPAFNDESFISAKEDYLTRLTFQLAKEDFPGRSTRAYMETWPKLSSDMLSLTDYGKYLRRNDGRDMAEQLAASATTDLEKAQAIYQYVNTTLAWNGENRYAPSQSPKQVLSERSGNSTDINLVLRNMLDFAGITAKPVLLSTRNHGQVSVKYPILNQFNYSVVHAVIDGAEYLLDGTDPDLPFGVLPLQCINGYGLIVDKDEERWVALASGEGYHTETFVTVAYDSVSNQLRAQVGLKEKGYAALYKRKAHREDPKQLPGFSEKKFGIKNLEDINKGVITSFESAYPVTQTPDFVYINPFHYSELDDNPFKAAQRQHPVDYSYLRTYKYTFSLKIPAGYEVEEAPTSTQYVLEDQSVQFLFQTQVTMVGVQVLSLMKVNRALIAADRYPQLKELYETLAAKHAESIVLKKQ